MSPRGARMPHSGLSGCDGPNRDVQATSGAPCLQEHTAALTSAAAAALLDDF
jgi:hypothetical protein